MKAKFNIPQNVLKYKTGFSVRNRQNFFLYTEKQWKISIRKNTKVISQNIFWIQTIQRKMETFIKQTFIKILQILAKNNTGFFL